MILATQRKGWERKFTTELHNPSFYQHFNHLGTELFWFCDIHLCHFHWRIHDFGGSIRQSSSESALHDAPYSFNRKHSWTAGRLNLRCSLSLWSRTVVSYAAWGLAKCCWNNHRPPRKRQRLSEIMSLLCINGTFTHESPMVYWNSLIPLPKLIFALFTNNSLDGRHHLWRAKHDGLYIFPKSWNKGLSSCLSVTSWVALLHRGDICLMQYSYRLHVKMQWHSVNNGNSFPRYSWNYLYWPWKYGKHCFFFFSVNCTLLFILTPSHAIFFTLTKYFYCLSLIK